MSTPLVPPRSRARSASVGSSRSLSDEGRRRKASLVPQTLGVPELEEPRPDSAGAHPPTYSSAAYPTHDVVYRFAQAGPFGMSLEADAAGKEAGLAHVWRYQVEVGVNVLTLRSWVTTVRRGGEDGLLVAEIESGLSAGSATVTMGDESRSSKEVLSRTLGSRMYYIGDGTAIRWNLGESRWEAYFDSVELATFESGPSRRMVVQPLGHRFFDHLVVAVLLLMREKDGDGTASRTDIGLLPTSPLG
ncbi:hypothetical protein BD413DRAFT_632384 [Trametes elegans]|nr:hypothetical protein BD413DRAFT_632384 [Trametes elegans]